MSEAAGRARYVVALDQGTTSSRAVLVDHDGQMVDVVQREFTQIYPKPGWVEHNPQEILFSQLGSLTQLLQKHGLGADDIACIGIDNQRETTIAASAPDVDHTEYALEGSVFVAGAVIQWLRDELGLIRDAGETEYLAQSVEDNGGVYIVPAFTGLGAPYWAPDARGTITGLTRGANRAHIARAALESLAYQSADLVHAMEADAGAPIATLNVDGGASRNNFLMQFQADLLGCELRRPQNIETTSLGAAYLAGLAVGFWSGTDELRGLRSTDDIFGRKMPEEKVQGYLAGWKEAVRRTL